MTDILARRNHRILQQYASSNLLVAFDFDGTLAPIVSTPSRARMRASTRRLLKQVAVRYPCAVISGRSRDDLVHYLHDVPVVHVSGNHGLEPWAQQRKYVRLVRQWVKRLTPALAAHEGVVIEDKKYSISIHYRLAPDRRAALASINAALQCVSGFRRIGGKLVVNLLPEGAPTKGGALERIRRQLSCERALYVGDDETDEDVFEASRRHQLLSIRVGESHRSRALFFLHDQRRIDGLLRELIALRSSDRTA